MRQVRKQARQLDARTAFTIFRSRIWNCRQMFHSLFRKTLAPVTPQRPCEPLENRYARENIFYVTHARVVCCSTNKSNYLGKVRRNVCFYRYRFDSIALNEQMNCVYYIVVRQTTLHLTSIHCIEVFSIREAFIKKANV